MKTSDMILARLFIRGKFTSPGDLTLAFRNFVSCRDKVSLELWGKTTNDATVDIILAQ